MSSSKSSATIYDVAKKAGVSGATVSRLLNAPDKVNAETRDRILAAIDQLGFVPKAEARARSLQQTRRVGVITPFFTAPSFVQRLRGIASALSKSSYELVIFPVDSSTQLENYFGTIPFTRNLDGLIIVSMPVSEKQAKRLQSFNIPTVTIESSHPGFSSVEIDDYKGGQLAAEYLLDRGHRRIAFMAKPEIPEYTVHSPAQRMTGFCDALSKAGVELPADYIRLVPDSQEQIHQATIDLLNLPIPPTAIFGALDVYALGVLKTARRLGVVVPGKLAVIGFDNLDASEYADMTTICQHLDESGRVAVEILMAHIEDPSRPIKHVHLPLTLVERFTT